MRFIQKNYLGAFRDSEEAKILHKKCQFLAFIPDEFVQKVFNLIKKDNVSTFLKKFINYFEKNFIKKNTDSSLFKLLFILIEDDAKINKEFNYCNRKGYI